MDYINHLCKKKMKLRPWIICGAFGYLVAIVFLIASAPFMAKANVMWFVIAIIIILGPSALPFTIADHISSKIATELAELAKAKIINFMSRKGRTYEAPMELDVSCRRIEGVYQLDIYAKNISVDFLALAAKDVVSEIKQEVKYNIRIETTIHKVL